MTVPGFWRVAPFSCDYAADYNSYVTAYISLLRDGGKDGLRDGRIEYLVTIVYDCKYELQSFMNTFIQIENCRNAGFDKAYLQLSYFLTT